MWQSETGGVSSDVPAGLQNIFMEGRRTGIPIQAGLDAIIRLGGASVKQVIITPRSRDALRVRVDRRAGKRVSPTRKCGNLDLVRPSTPVDEVLASIWRSLLSLEVIGTNDNFFDLGGQSLLATQLISRIRAIFGHEMSLRDFFESPTISHLSQAIFDSETQPGTAATIARLATEIEKMPESALGELLHEKESVQVNHG